MVSSVELDTHYLSGQPVLLLLEQVEMDAQCLRVVAFSVEDPSDVRDPDAELAQEQNPLQSHERRPRRSTGSRCRRCGWV